MSFTFENLVWVNFYFKIQVDCHIRFPYNVYILTKQTVGTIVVLVCLYSISCERILGKIMCWCKQEISLPAICILLNMQWFSKTKKFFNNFFDEKRYTACWLVSQEQYSLFQCITNKTRYRLQVTRNSYHLIPNNAFAITLIDHFNICNSIFWGKLTTGLPLKLAPS